MKLNGWHRIVIVISVAWLLALAGFIGYERQNSNPFCEFGTDGPACHHAFWSWVYLAPEQFAFTLRHGEVAAAALVPLAVLWFCFGATLWIKGGFSKNP